MRAAFLVLLTLSLSAGAAAEDRPAPPLRITLELCATDVTSHEWAENLNEKVKQILRMGTYPKQLIVLFSSTGRPCREVLFGCHAEPHEILCSEQSINRLILASAWLAAHDAQQIVRLHRRMPLKQILEEVGEMDFNAAVEIADATNSNDSEKLNSLISFHGIKDDLKDLVTEIQKMETDPNFHPTLPAILIAGPIYDIASTELVALLLGHEFSHAMGGCHLNAPSSVERSGQFERLLSMQAQGAGFIRDTPSIDEILADECAFRVLEQVDASWVADDSSETNRSLTKEIHHGGRWIALDAYATLLTDTLSRRSTSGLGGNVEDYRPGIYMIGPGRALMAEEPEGYLFPASRLALVAMTLHERQAREDPGHKIVLCELAAEQFVAMLHIAGHLDKDDKSPMFADLFGTIVAPGVAAALRTGVWYDKNPGSSYACNQ